jgi:type II secretory ATPase GspE/PulE/Tfp pilus assembly ATPase PilB-like protein
MGIDPFLVSSSLVCSIAQRLVRRICRHCLEPDPAMPDDLRDEMAKALQLPPGDLKASRGRGCIECNSKGYRGRVAIYEFFLINDDIADLIGPEVKTGQLRQAARAYGWRSLRELGWIKVHHGLIPIAEQERMTRRIGTGQIAAVR